MMTWSRSSSCYPLTLIVCNSISTCFMILVEGYFCVHVTLSHCGLFHGPRTRACLPFGLFVYFCLHVFSLVSFWFVHICSTVNKAFTTAICACVLVLYAPRHGRTQPKSSGKYQISEIYMIRWSAKHDGKTPNHNTQKHENTKVKKCKHNGKQTVKKNNKIHNSEKTKTQGQKDKQQWNKRSKNTTGSISLRVTLRMMAFHVTKMYLD